MGTNKDQLTNAITNLKVHPAPEIVWESLSDRLKEDAKIQHVKHQMEVRMAPDFVWNNIQNELNHDEIFKKAIHELPTRRVPAELFDGIRDQIENKSNAFNWKFHICVAASILLVIASVWMYQPSIHGEISYREEIVDIAGDALEPDKSDIDDEILSYVNSNCLTLHLKCESLEFKGLLNLYEELKDTEEELRIEVKEQKGVESLVTYLVQVEKEKAEVGKQLIYLMTT